MYAASLLRPTACTAIARGRSKNKQTFTTSLFLDAKQTRSRSILRKAALSSWRAVCRREAGTTRRPERRNIARRSLLTAYNSDQVEVLGAQEARSAAILKRKWEETGGLA